MSDILIINDSLGTDILAHRASGDVFYLSILTEENGAKWSCGSNFNRQSVKQLRDFIDKWLDDDQ